MRITDEMIDTAMKTAIDAGLLPRDVVANDVMNRRALIRQILESALQTASEGPETQTDKALESRATA